MMFYEVIFCDHLSHLQNISTHKSWLYGKPKHMPHIVLQKGMNRRERRRRILSCHKSHKFFSSIVVSQTIISPIFILVFSNSRYEEKANIYTKDTARAFTTIHNKHISIYLLTNNNNK